MEMFSEQSIIVRFTGSFFCVSLTISLLVSGDGQVLTPDGTKNGLVKPHITRLTARFSAGSLLFHK